MSTTTDRPLIPYLRQSRAKERTISIDEQRRDVRRWAEAAGAELAPEVVEKNVSGSKSWRERALGEAVDACERGEAAGIIVAFQDRLSRENGAATAEVWEALDRAGARFVSAGEGIDTATGDQEMLFTIRAAIARDQWKRYRANWERARRSTIERGIPASRAPFGYRKARGKRLEVDPRAAGKVLEAFELRAAGVPMTEVGRRFGWSHSTARQILANDVYLGVLRHGEFVNEAAHDPIVPRDLFDAVQATRTTQPVPPGETTRDRLLTGLARCGGCGRTLKVVRRPRSDGTYVASYYCKNAASDPCPSRAYVHADDLDCHVAEWFAGALVSVPRMIDVVAAGRDLENAQRDLTAAEKSLNAYVVAAVDIDPATWRRGYDAHEGRVNEARERVQQLSARQSRIPAGGSLSALWSGFTVAERRDVLAGFIGRVEVDRGASGGLAGHIRIFWTDGTLAGDESRVRKAAA